MRSIAQNWLLVGVILSLISCGTAKKSATQVNPVPPTPTPTPTVPSNDANPAPQPVTNAYTVMGFNAVEDAVDAISNDGSSFTLSWSAGGTDPTRARVCAPGANNEMLTTVTLSSASAQTITKPNMTMVANMTWGGHETRAWTPPVGQSLACNSDGTQVNVNWTNAALVNYLYISVGVDKSRTVSKTITSGGKSVLAADNVKTSGSRIIRWANNGTATTTTVAGSVTITRTTVDIKGVTTSFVTTLKIDENAPLMVAVERSAKDGSLVSKTISSGMQISTMTDGSTLKTTFANVKFNLASTATNKCQPISGTVSGALYAAGATAATTTFLIMFGDATVDSGVSITYPGQGSQDYSEYNAKGCDLENDL